MKQHESTNLVEPVSSQEENRLITASYQMLHGAWICRLCVGAPLWQGRMAC
jgi:hypothetical protein